MMPETASSPSSLTNADWAPFLENQTQDSDLDGVGDNADWAKPFDSNKPRIRTDGVGDNADWATFDESSSILKDSDNDGVGTDNADAIVPIIPTEIHDSQTWRW